MPLDHLHLALIEDQLLIRESFAHTISRALPASTVHLFSSCREALDQKQVLATCDLALLDLQLADERGQDYIPVLRKYVPRLRIVVVTGLTAPVNLHEVTQHTPEGFIHKSDTAEVFIAAIRAVASGQIFESPQIQRLRSSQRQDPLHFSKILTIREQDTLKLIGQGLTNEEAAAVLGVKADTLQTHRRNIMGKLGLHRTTDLIAYAIRSGFAPSPEFPPPRQDPTIG